VINGHLKGGDDEIYDHATQHAAPASHPPTHPRLESMSEAALIVSPHSSSSVNLNFSK